LIAKKEKTEKPNTMLALICGAINVADQVLAKSPREIFFYFCT
jgi:hypothetical protein